MERIINAFARSDSVSTVLRWMAGRDRQGRIAALGLRGSAANLWLAAVARQSHARIVFVADDADRAAYAYNDLNGLVEHAVLLPSAYRPSGRREREAAAEIMRTDALNTVTSAERYIVFTSAEGLAERVVPAGLIGESRIIVHRGDEMEQDDFVTRLEALGFTEVEFVYEPGQYSRRGSIVDVYSFANELPFRLDFFGTTVESLRTFDIRRQLSVEQRERVDILPDMPLRAERKSLVSFFELLAAEAIVVFENYDATLSALDRIFEQSLSGNRTTMKGEQMAREVSERRIILLHSTRELTPELTINFSETAQPLFHKDFDILSSSLRDYLCQGYKINICSDSVKQTDRIRSIFDDRGDRIPFTPIPRTVHEGFVDRDLKLVLFTDHQIFDRFHRFMLKSDAARQGQAAEALKEINELQIGDYVVHQDHGVGRFGGLVVMEDDGRRRETIKIIYAENDTLYVSIHGLHKVSKYKSRDGEPPRINRLGSGAWDRLKERAKKKIKDIARDLIELYGRRAEQQGFRFRPDDYMQHELEASFRYEDTPDQAEATRAIKQDMESGKPMDRLVCGDVGFGKTELAIRAAFKAVLSGKQVAVLVPTTVLALQHYKTFSERLRQFPVRVEYLSRAKSAKETREIREALAAKRIDILVGTHKIVGRDIAFADLGLLIIDEEQKFGVAVKERLRQMKANVDTLTLTATPIPRTLQFSLMGARDMSLLSTPPPNRYPVLTEVTVWDDTLIADAIRTEMGRNGQVFFVHNRVDSLEVILGRLKRIVPEARIGIAHGQMPAGELEETIMDFIEYDYDVLLSTTVVESGIDIPNVNTIIINNAHMFGLADLHQLRGRVGRSNRKAYCYLLAPEQSLLPTDAQRRLRAIETFADLGSGFNLAMQDLDTRGAGNVLGAEQSGFIADLGYDTYRQILQEAMAELRSESHMPTPEPLESDCTVETDLEIMLPDDYVSSETERVVLYRELDSLRGEEQIARFRERLVDRFGPEPAAAESLFTIVRLRRAAGLMGIERIVLRRGRMMLTLPEQGSAWYERPCFLKMLDWMKHNPRTARIEPFNGHGRLTADGVPTAEAALRIVCSFSD